MSSLGKLTNSFFSATNENSISFANFNFDISLVKLEAPKEFNGLGSTLSIQRRNNAEDGPLHKTLRKLGALFEQVVPSTPRLIKAYGLRSSEIIQLPGISPKGSKSDGPFEAFIGADGTSIWAAAASGPAALGVHLLACMLSRQFDDAKVSTAIWVEIVHERQLQIKAAVEDNLVVSISTAMMARQDISREELAVLDASVRSWLSSADEAKMSSQKKLMLILRNINIPISSGSSTYGKVIEAWKQAMSGFEDLLSGMPQQVSSGAILRALSAWHLFPNLIVLVGNTVNVRFEDPLLPEESVVTIGLQQADANHQGGIQWSLTLSHLRYYGDPVPIESHENNSRVTMRQLHLIAFGSLLKAWKVLSKDTTTTALWFQELWHQLEDVQSNSVNPLPRRLCWLTTLVTAAKIFLDSQIDDAETSHLLVNYGRRRGRSFLCELLGDYPRPFFGLGNLCISTAMTAKDHVGCGIQYLREVAKSIELVQNDALIAYTFLSGKTRYLEFATALKHSIPSPETIAKWTYQI
ncbi:hypothetical protein MMC12_007036 [Toensbergia leucococca]|nr:hypothetical protein [Toensbergia leucococca]